MKNLSEKIELLRRTFLEIGRAICLSLASAGVKVDALTQHIKEIKPKEGYCLLNYLDSGSSFYIIAANIDIRS